MCNEKTCAKCAPDETQDPEVEGSTLADDYEVEDDSVVESADEDPLQ